MSVPTIKRAIRDLDKAGLVRKLNRQQTRAFFAEELAEGKRWADRLPCVLELMVPASAYPEPTRAEINEVRAKLGEEPLDDTTRPYPSVETTDQIREHDDSCCDTDPCPSDACPRKNPGSVRGTSTTGEQTRQKSRSGLFGIIDRIPNIFLANPMADRDRLALAVEKLLRQGLSEADIRTLLWGMERLRRPFPALMRRLCDMSAAHRYLNGSLGRGVHGSSLPTPSWSVSCEDGDTFDHPEQFRVDSQGKATGTCPEHKSTRNVPGSTCSICGRRCRSVPGELMHELAPGAADLPEGVSALKAVDLSPEPEEVAALDSKLLGRMGESLNGAGRAHFVEPVLRNGLWVTSDAGPTTEAQKGAGLAREQLAKDRTPKDLDIPVSEQAKAC